MSIEQKLSELLSKQVNSKDVHSGVLAVCSPSQDFKWQDAAGDAHTDSEFFIASTTKMFTAAIIMQLVEEVRVKLEDKISNYIDQDLMAGLHLYKGVDYSDNITVRHLLSNTSGLPDYFSGKDEAGKTQLDRLLEDGDTNWTAVEAIELSKTRQAPLFSPGTIGKAHYSDTNFQLLKLIIEKITDNSIDQVVYSRISARLNLKQTYMFTGNTSPLPFYYKNIEMNIPKAMASVTTDGGMVSTGNELLTFVKGFFQGELFRAELLDEMQNWNPIFFPLQYGTGMMRFKLPRLFSPFAPLPEMLGHSGVTGAFAYYVPSKNLYIAGTLNQIHPNSRPYKLLVQVANLF